MQYASLDKLIRGVLLDKGYSLHWYLQCLVYAKTCLRELHLDDLKVVNSVLLDVDSYNACQLPTDFVDYVVVGLKCGQLIKPLVPTDDINRLKNRNENGQVIKYTDSPYADASNTLFYDLTAGYYWRTITFNEYGESIGRLFGFGNGFETDSFIVLPERCQIQLNEAISVDKIVLQYISNGMSCDAASQVDVYAQRTIETYIYWQLKEHNRHYGEGEKMRAENEYLKQRKILRARKDGLTIEKIKRIYQKNFMQAPKS